MTKEAAPRPVGYYVHHHGAGHGAHALALAGALDRPVVGLGSGGPPAGWRGRWVALERDDGPPRSSDPTRGGTWHWLPSGHDGLSGRMRAVASWIAEANPSAFVSDVSCEVTVLAALLGVPTAHVLLHGDRGDRPHRTAFDTADLLLAPWPAIHAESGHRRWAAKTRHLGLLSRFDDRREPTHGGDGSVLVVVPGGDHPFRTDAVEVAAVATGRRWTVAGAAAPEGRAAGGPVEWLGPVEDLWPHLLRASVVVAAGGAGSIGDIAAARRPALLLPQPRPFDEQVRGTAHLAGTAPVHVLASWPTDGWGRLVDEVAALDGTAWAGLHDRGGAHRFAAAVAGLGRGSPGTSP